MMDVLEHIEDDRGYLRDILRLLKKDGTVFITVPAFMSLYSLHDEELKHFRRYNHKQLKEVTVSAGLKEKKWSYFYFCLIPLRLLTKNKTENASRIGTASPAALAANSEDPTTRPARNAPNSIETPKKALAAAARPRARTRTEMVKNSR